MTPPYWNDAQTHLTKACPTLGGLIAAYEGESLMSRGDAFYTLARSIAGQQISVKAADSVWNRVEACLLSKNIKNSPLPLGEGGAHSATGEGSAGPDRKRPSPRPSPKGRGGVTPAAVLATSDEDLRACGLSGSKVKYMRYLAEFFVAEKIKPGFWDEMPDEEVIKHITQIKGIGVWTAEMFMIFHLQRPNIFPLADIGLQKAILRHYPKIKAPTPKNLLKISKKWHPYRSVATWYLWRALDPVPVEY